ncbi:MAG: type II CAAX endopeptidase family protein [Melioribacteraceae bacterium]|nr:type II CAAX endopeptidase family protein [Melioribacteraceae bacterium]
MNNNFQKPEDSDEERDFNDNHLSPTMSPIAAAFIGLVFVFILYQIAGSLLTLLIFGFDLESANMNAMRLMTIAGQVLFILLPALIFAKLIYEDVGTIIRFKLPNWKEILAFVIGLALLSPLLQSYLYIQTYIIDELAKHVSIVHSIKEVLDSLDKLVTETYSELLRADSIFEGSFIIIVVAVVPAICEEVFFRGYVQKSFELSIKPVWAIILTALFFAMYHFNPYGLVALIALGIFFGFAAYKSGSIFIPMILHFLNNLLAVVMFFVLGVDEFMQVESIDPSEIGINIILFIFFLVLFLGYILVLRKQYHKLKN